MGDTRVRHRMSTFLIFALVLSTAVPAVAGAPTERIKAGVDQVVRILEDQGTTTPARKAAIRRVAENMFDYREFARRSLGRHWTLLSEAEREEFVGLFTNLLERAYISQLEKYHGERIAYAGESVQGGIATVRTRLKTREGSDVKVDYQLAGRAGGWRVADIVIEGVSMTGSYRSQFEKVIQNSSFQELMRRMRSTAASDRTANSS